MIAIILTLAAEASPELLEATHEQSFRKQAMTSEQTELSVQNSEEGDSSTTSDDDIYYDGFGGVALGYQQYKNFAKNTKSTLLLDGREGIDMEHIAGTTVSSFYFSRIAKSKIYVGYSVTAMFADRVVSSEDANSLMLPYWCPAYWNEVSSVNGGKPGGDQNVFHDQEGTYELYGDTYEYSCNNQFGARSNRETLVHIPAEINFAYVMRPIKKMQVWVSGGMSISWYDYKYSFNQSGFTSVHDSYLTDEDLDYSWSYEYAANFGASQTVSEGGWEEFKKSYLPGIQAALGTEYVFGKLPRIGGDWGLGLIAKYSVIRGSEFTYQPKYFFDAEVTSDSGGVSRSAFNEQDTEKVRPTLSNWNLSAALSWHY